MFLTITAMICIDISDTIYFCRYFKLYFVCIIAALDYICTGVCDAVIGHITKIPRVLLF